jgi:hypothetical protein
MSDPSTRSRRIKAVALLGAGAVAGIIGAATLSANAASSSGSSSSSTSTTQTAPSGAPAAPNGHGPQGAPGGQNPNETVVTGTKAATLRAAALEHVSGGTVDKIETDSGDAAYEVHMTNSSGQQVTVKFDKALNFVNVEDGMGK